MGRNTSFEQVVIELILLITASSFILAFLLVFLKAVKRIEYKHFGIVLIINTATWLIPFLLGIMFYQMRGMAN